MILPIVTSYNSIYDFPQNTIDELDKAGKLTMPQLEEKGISRDLILKALNKDLIRFVGEPEKAQNDKNFRIYTEPDEGIPCFLTITGFEYLNQIRIKKAIEQLDSSIKKFNESSDKYSKKIVELTFAVYVFTIIVAALPIYEKIIQLGKVDPISEIILLFVGVVSIVAVMLVLNKKYRFA